ncbi:MULTISPECIES: DUF2239 family protein [Sphingobium]|uniref:DUF2239 family protein n=1 Tax=Sphingobium tyrosinilyticum TaxID=2715436 RepID=A0ABV9EUY8_9SPHN|nr:DUF2239 family protein [Sphingobium sp. EP60837]ANI77185.1 hypothetical protein EP837_00747 [Sphingobium sp. EP60837]
MARTYTAFSGELWIATGDEDEVRAALRAMGYDAQNLLLFDDLTGRQIDLDLREPAQRGRGRPKMGVQAREVTLLPRHWEWLATQAGGASATLRRLVEQARKASEGQVTPRAAMDAAYHFLTVMAGDRPGYEAAIRALYAKDRAQFEAQTAGWPAAIREHALALASPAFD